MRWVKGMLDKVSPAFGEGGRLRRFRPLFDAMENFFFWPAEPTEALPHVRDPLDVKRFMFTVILALIPCVLAAFYFFGWRVLVVIVVSYAAGGAVEVAFACIRKEQINEGFLVTGLVFPLVLPPAIPLWMVAVGVAFGVTVGKEIFGGTGRNLFNPALVGRCFLFIAYPSPMTTGWIEPAGGGVGALGRYLNFDAVTAATPLSESAMGQFALWDLFIGNVPGTIGATCSLAILLGGAFLLATRVANYRPALGMLGSFALCGWALNLSGRFGPIEYHLLAGGLLFGAFFMATDPVSAPSTNPARWAYGIVVGVLTALIRGLTPLPEGVMFAILLGNIVAPVLDEVVIRTRMRRLARER